MLVVIIIISVGISREQWKCKTWNLVKQLEGGLEIGYSCTRNEISKDKRKLSPEWNLVEHLYQGAYIRREKGQLR